MGWPRRRRGHLCRSDTGTAETSGVAVGGSRRTWPDIFVFVVLLDIIKP